MFSRTSLTFILLILVAEVLAQPELRVFKTYQDFVQDKTSREISGLHMNGALKGEGVVVKFLDEEGKKVDLDPETFWGITYDSVVFRTALDVKIQYAAVRKMGEHLFFFYPGTDDLRLLANPKTYGERAASEFPKYHMNGLLEGDKFYIGARLDGPMVWYRAGLKQYKEAFSRYYKEDAVERFHKDLTRATSDKKRYEAMVLLLKNAK